MTGDVTHWQGIYESKALNDVSWFEDEPTMSLQLIDEFAGKPGPAVDVGAGRSRLAIRLLDRGWHPVVALDVSSAALAHIAEIAQPTVDLQLIACDILQWQPQDRVALWHDRAVFHFLTDSQDQIQYIELAMRTVSPGGTLVLGCFAVDGPTQCSGLDVCRFQPGDLAALFSAGFSLLASAQQDHRTPWGSSQAFTWVVLRRHG